MHKWCCRCKLGILEGSRFPQHNLLIGPTELFKAPARPQCCSSGSPFLPSVERKAVLQYSRQTPPGTWCVPLESRWSTPTPFESILYFHRLLTLYFELSFLGRSFLTLYCIMCPMKTRTFTIFIFVSVQSSHSVMSDPLQPHELQHARLPCPSPIHRTCSNSCPSSQWCHPTISSSPAFGLSQHQDLF